MKIFGTIAAIYLLSFIAGAAEADTITLDYQSNTMTGTSSYLPPGYSCGMGCLTLPSASVTGTVSGTLVFTGSIAANDLELTSFDFIFSGSNGSPFSVGAQEPYPLISNGNGSFQSLEGDLTVTTSNGSITGANFAFTVDPYHGSLTSLTIGQSGDAFNYSYGTTGGSCQNMIGYATVNPCTVSASDSTAGVWTVASSTVPLPATIWLMLGGLMFAGISTTRQITKRVS